MGLSGPEAFSISGPASGYVVFGASGMSDDGVHLRGGCPEPDAGGARVRPRHGSPLRIYSALRGLVGGSLGM